MVYTVLWYTHHEVLLLELLGRYSLNDYVQVCHRARDSFLEKEEHSLDLIIDFRSTIFCEPLAIPIEPLENLVRHSLVRRIFFLANPDVASLLADVCKQGAKLAKLHIVGHLGQVDRMLALRYKFS